MQYFRPENHALVLEALRRAGREDLIGFGRNVSSPAPHPPGEKRERAPVPPGKPKDGPRKGRQAGASRRAQAQKEAPRQTLAHRQAARVDIAPWRPLDRRSALCPWAAFCGLFAVACGVNLSI